MKISKQWLDNFFDTPLPSAQEVADALTFHAFEIDGIEKVGNDSVLDVKVTANRGHDCLSHRAIAKELSAILNIPLAKDPFKKTPDLSKKTDAVTVTIESSALCKRYIAGYVKGVKVGPSPEWLKTSLEAIGQRSINNVVDATNLVMFNTGQPLHAFDSAKLGSFDIGVRLARKGERIVALDTKEYALTESMLLITAGDIPVGIAGVKGGMPAAVDETTQDIVIESANFDGVSVRKTASALKLRTDASARFEQVISPELAAYGMQQAVDLILAIAGGEVQGFVDEYPSPQTAKPVSVSTSFVNATLGTMLSDGDIEDVFKRLQFAYEKKGSEFVITPPFERLDIVIPEDLAEEVGRIVGYDKVPAVPLSQFPKPVEASQNFLAGERVREELMSQGYSEVYTSVFAEKGERTVLNKVDGVRPHLRSDTADSLKEAISKNVLNRMESVKLFEIGTVWKKGKEEIHVARGGEKEEVKEEVLSSTDGEAVGTLPVSTTERYVPFSKFPFILRDISFWAPITIDVEKFRDQIAKWAGPACLNVKCFDRFEKGEKVSLAYRITFQSFDRTLTDDEVNAVMKKVTEEVTKEGFEVR